MAWVLGATTLAVGVAAKKIAAEKFEFTKDYHLEGTPVNTMETVQDRLQRVSFTTKTEVDPVEADEPAEPLEDEGEAEPKAENDEE